MLDPDIAVFLKDQEAVESVPLDKIPVGQSRENDQIVLDALWKGTVVPGDVEIEDTIIPGVNPIPVRRYIPYEKRDDALIIFYHGGGWVFGSIRATDLWCRKLASETGISVVSVEYRCAPESRFPAPLEDCYWAYHWIANHQEEYGVRSVRIALCGDSAGGNLSAAVCLKGKEEGAPPIAAQFLIYPVTDLSNRDTRSYNEYGTSYLLTRASMGWLIKQYTRNSGDTLNPLVSPLLAEDLSGLPPAVVITAEYDPLRDEGDAYARRLKEAGIRVEHHCYKGMIHAFMHMGEISSRAAANIHEMMQVFKNFL